MDQMVATVQQWLNDTYSLGVTVDGITGNSTFTALIKHYKLKLGSQQTAISEQGL